MLRILLSLWCSQGFSITLLFTQSGPAGENGQSYFVKHGGMLYKLIDYAIYSSFSRLIISTLTKHWVFESPRALHALPSHQDTCCWERENMGDPNAPGVRWFSGYGLKGHSISGNESEVHISTCSLPPPTRSVSGVGPCRMYFNSPRMWAPDLVLTPLARAGGYWWRQSKHRTIQDSRWEVRMLDRDLFFTLWASAPDRNHRWGLRTAPPYLCYRCVSGVYNQVGKGLKPKISCCPEVSHT